MSGKNGGVNTFTEKWNKDYTSKFDIDLKFGEEFEYSLARILSIGKVEIKTERDQWKKTGNIAIEYSYKGHDSGLKSTESDIWVHNLVKDDEIYCSLFFPIDKLKQLCNKMPKFPVHGGDNMDSKMLLLNLRRLIDELIIMAKNKEVK